MKDEEAGWESCGIMMIDEIHKVMLRKKKKCVQYDAYSVDFGDLLLLVTATLSKLPHTVSTLPPESRCLGEPSKAYIPN